MNTRCLHSLSSVPHSFQYIDLSNFLVQFIPKYFDAIINRVVFFHSFSDISLLVYKNVADFCMLISYPETTEFVLIMFWWHL